MEVVCSVHIVLDLRDVTGCLCCLMLSKKWLHFGAGWALACHPRQDFSRSTLAYGGHKVIHHA